MRGFFQIKHLLTISAVLIISLQTSFGGRRTLCSDERVSDKATFAESLAEFVSGKVLEQDPDFQNGRPVCTSVVWIPTYYGYHSFLGVLDSFIIKHTAITSLRTWRLADRNLYVIHLSQENISVSIIYDLRDSLLLMTTPPGY
jgi:hypothetical protein